MDAVLTQAQTSPWKSLVIERHVSDAVLSTFSSDLINLRIQEWSVDLLPEHQWLSLCHVGPSVKERPAPLKDHPFLWSHDHPHLNLWIWGPCAMSPGLILHGHCCDFSVMDHFRRHTPATRCSVSGIIQIFVSLEIWQTELKRLSETGHSPWGQKLLRIEPLRNPFCRRRLMYK